MFNSKFESFGDGNSKPDKIGDNDQYELDFGASEGTEKEEPQGAKKTNPAAEAPVSEEERERQEKEWEENQEDIRRTYQRF